DVDSLRARQAPPADAAIAAKASALRVAVARARSLLLAGKIREGLELARSATAEARALGYEPLLAEALVALGMGLEEGGLPAEARLTDASFTALAVRDEEVLADAALELVWVVGGLRHRPADGDVWARHAEAAAKRLSQSAARESKRLDYLGMVRRREGRAEDA